MTKKESLNLIGSWYKEAETFRRKIALALLWLKFKLGFEATIADLEALPKD